MSCPKGMPFEECELEILRRAVDNAETSEASKLIANPDIQKIIKEVEDFIRRRKLVCYGGTAINNLLPVDDQFYNLDIELPDYDVYSGDAMNDAIDLANIYHKMGFDEVEAKAGMHHGTYKVYVNYIPVADITQVGKEVMRNIVKHSISIAGIKYAPINYLRMNMYKELSRPKGDISRWEKVLKRLTLFNKNYPLRGENCKVEMVQRAFEDSKTLTKDDIHKLFYITRDSFINQGLVFFGAYASSLYLKKMKRRDRVRSKNSPDFDVISSTPEMSAEILKERLHEAGYKKVTIHKKPGADEIIAEHYEVKVGDETIAFIYKPIECHAYNLIKRDDKKIKIATIDTMLNLFLAFLFADRGYYNKERIVCMCEYLFRVQQQNRLSQRGVLKRFSIDCYGDPVTIQGLLETRHSKYLELKKNRNSKEFKSWFLRYRPAEEKAKKTKKKARKQTRKKRKSKKKSSTRKRLLKLVGL